MEDIFFTMYVLNSIIHPNFLHNYITMSNISGHFKIINNLAEHDVNTLKFQSSSEETEDSDLL